MKAILSVTLALSTISLNAVASDALSGTWVETSESCASGELPTATAVDILKNFTMTWADGKVSTSLSYKGCTYGETATYKINGNFLIYKDKAISVNCPTLPTKTIAQPNDSAIFSIQGPTLTITTPTVESSVCPKGDFTIETYQKK